MASDPIALALIRELCRQGSLDASDIERIATDLEASGHGDEAHAVRCELLKASAPSVSDWQAEQRRARFTVLPDGGN